MLGFSHLFQEGQEHVLGLPRHEAPALNSEDSLLEHDRSISRRTVIRRTVGGVLACGSGAALFEKGSPAWAAEPTLIVRNTRPLDLETPVTALDRWLTPNDLFFVRSHLSTPAIGLAPWSLQVSGMTDRPRTWSLDDLQKLEQVKVPAVLQCSGNGRAYFRPRLPGVQWEKGGVGHAEWSGVRLVDLLERAGYQRGAAHVHLLGADAPPNPRTPQYLRSVPIERAIDPNTLVATHMNDEPLPLLHGGPMRLVVPGWTGNHWMKWLREIKVAKDEAPGTYQQSGYRIPKSPAPPGAVLKPSDLVPLTTMNVKSLITGPADGTVLKPGKHEIRGVAWTGAGHVTKVEYTIGTDPNPNSEWRPATLQGEPRQGSWRTWKVAWEPDQPGKYTVRVRATDSQGETQPETTVWNRSGYLWNGIDRLTCEVQ